MLRVAESGDTDAGAGEGFLESSCVTWSEKGLLDVENRKLEMENLFVPFSSSSLAVLFARFISAYDCRAEHYCQSSLVYNTEKPATFAE